MRKYIWVIATIILIFISILIGSWIADYILEWIVSRENSAALFQKHIRGIYGFCILATSSFVFIIAYITVRFYQMNSLKS